MADQTPDAPATPAASTPAKKKRNLVPILIVVGVIVIVIIGAVAYKLRGSSSSSSKPSGPPPGAVAKRLYKAWQSGNQADAAKSANPAAVGQIFAIKASDGTGLTFGGCKTAGSSAFPKTCVFSRSGGQLTMTVSRANGTKTVTHVTLSSAATTPTSTTG
jgi:ABC-type nitrate/sulfonate/bicarbonate transport system permease component